MEFDELMRQLAGKMGLSELTPEDGTVAITIDDIPFGFIVDNAAGTLTLVADIGQQPGAADRPLGAMMLKANFLYEALQGAVLFLNPDNEAFGIEQRFRLVDLDADGLYRHVERLANLADEWRRIVAGYGVAEKAAQALAANDPHAGHLNGGHFLRV